MSDIKLKCALCDKPERFVDTVAISHKKWHIAGWSLNKNEPTIFCPECQEKRLKAKEKKRKEMNTLLIIGCLLVLALIYAGVVASIGRRQAAERAEYLAEISPIRAEPPVESIKHKIHDPKQDDMLITCDCHPSFKYTIYPYEYPYTMKNPYSFEKDV